MDGEEAGEKEWRKNRRKDDWSDAKDETYKRAVNVSLEKLRKRTKKMRRREQTGDGRAGAAGEPACFRFMAMLMSSDEYK